MPKKTLVPCRIVLVSKYWDDGCIAVPVSENNDYVYDIDEGTFVFLPVDSKKWPEE